MERGATSVPGDILLDAFEGSGRPALPGAVIVAAHPDDETIGAGAQLRRFRTLRVVLITDGAPRGEHRPPGFKRVPAEEYAGVRRRELDSVLALAGVPPGHVIPLEVPDQEASFSLPRIAGLLASIFESLAPEIVITHPYEGGHPDHDAAAFAVHAALRRQPDRDPRPILIEMTSYHRGPRGVETGVFLPCPGRRETVVRLTDEEKRLKARLFACYSSQRRVLEMFGIEEERFRIAPGYDFTAPPHEGPLHYEKFGWRITPEEWRRQARLAMGI